MNDRVFKFEFTYIEGTKRNAYFLSMSKEMAWIVAASYVSCHVLNPSVESIRFVSAYDLELVPKENIEKILSRPFAG